VTDRQGNHLEEDTVETIARTVADVITELAQERHDRAEVQKAHELDMAARARRIAELEHERDLMMGSSITSEQIALARSLVYIEGRISESAGGAFQAAVDALAAGGRGLLRRYIGAKRYEHFHQRCDCEYGYGPTHGSVVFAVGLTREARERLDQTAGQLLPHERDAVVRWLLAEKALV
jgi:hypothetical protein